MYSLVYGGARRSTALVVRVGRASVKKCPERSEAGLLSSSGTLDDASVDATEDGSGDGEDVRYEEIGDKGASG